MGVLRAMCCNRRIFVKGKAQHKIQELSLQLVEWISLFGFYTADKKNCHSRRLSMICTPTHPDPTANLNPLFFFPLFIYASHLDLRLSPITAGTFWPWGFHTCKCPSTASLPLISPSNQNYHPLPPHFTLPL